MVRSASWLWAAPCGPTSQRCADYSTLRAATSGCRGRAARSDGSRAGVRPRGRVHPCRDSSAADPERRARERAPVLGELGRRVSTWAPLYGLPASSMGSSRRSALRASLAPASAGLSGPRCQGMPRRRGDAEGQIRGRESSVRPRGGRGRRWHFIGARLVTEAEAAWDRVSASDAYRPGVGDCHRVAPRT